MNQTGWTARSTVCRARTPAPRVRSIPANRAHWPRCVRRHRCSFRSCCSNPRCRPRPSCRSCPLPRCPGQPPDPYLRRLSLFSKLVGTPAIKLSNASLYRRFPLTYLRSAAAANAEAVSGVRRKNSEASLRLSVAAQRNGTLMGHPLFVSGNCPGYLDGSGEA